ncbi:hypothetical protein FDP08_05875 [Marinobacter panjinensis]|uniref:Uncharacterized protein n=1 Tax=Marinobacter panjinensis TaxID=2576384 RepID=A0A4U6R212_9GAMM|nr:hypothetical protein [Marinobacter panjinensis]MCR8913703.1 hypothetical protein [Marinobacter panjinensis]TKV67647.1 hypothetical protein FDP08_05875 [Marinobacter panjinensis]
MAETVDALRAKGGHVTEIAHRKVLNTTERKQRYIPFTFSILDVFKSLILIFRNGSSLYKEIREKHPAAIDFYLDNFFGVYTYLIYFHRVLHQINPDFVITANDHNSSNRSLLAVAHYLRIKTVYLQHASVSTLFPALRVDYAFLDGQSAWDTYKQCEPNQPVSGRNVPDTQVILSGQKKHLRVNESMTDVVGVALNALDDADAAIEFVEGLAANGRKVCVRWHPGQPERQIRRYRAAFAYNKMVELSDPKKEPVSDFFLRIGYVVAGNSSIHLEAALAGILPIYYELTPADIPDYYGYVKHGLSRFAKTLDEVSRLIEASEGHHKPDVEAVRYYSSTYLTDWDGREGELVAECLQRLANGQELPVGMSGLGKSFDGSPTGALT